MSYSFNVGKGRLHQLIDDGANIRLLLLSAAAAESVLKDLDDVAAVLANGSTDEATFTNYVRKLLSVTKTVNDTDDRVEYSFSPVVYTEAGGASNNTVIAALIYHDVDTTDANAVPLGLCDVTFTTDGNDVTLNAPAGGFADTRDPA